MFGPITVVFFIIVFALVLTYLLMNPAGPESESNHKSGGSDD